MKTKRISNLELLRILAMLMIICSHIYVHCIANQLNGAWHSELYCNPAFYKSLGILALMSPTGTIGNAIFILISGYFMASKESWAINLTKTAQKLLSQLGFATTMLVIASSIVITIANTSWDNVSLNSYMTFFSFNSMSWFIGYYFVVIVIAKLVLNARIAKLEKNQYLMLLVTMFATIQFAWSTGLLSSLMSGLEVVVTGLFLYTLGGYIRKYNPFAKVRSWILAAIIILTNVVVYINYYLGTIKNINNFNPDDGNLFMQSIPGYGNNNIVTLLLGITIFEIFKRIPSFSSNIVNFISAATFMVYLIHDNEFFYSLWNTTDWLPLLYDDKPAFFLMFITWMGITFASGLVAYIIYILLGKLLSILRPLAIRR